MPSDTEYRETHIITSTVKPIFTYMIPITMVRDASAFREAISTLYGGDWVSTEQKGSDFAVTVSCATPVDLKEKLQEDKVLRNDQELRYSKKDCGEKREMVE
ncbi:hypothetical protein LRP88_01331 [Fusarium phalaenopsidis]